MWIPNSIPPKALDEHIMVGGKYFDVLEGKYEIEKKYPLLIYQLKI